MELQYLIPETGSTDDKNLKPCFLPSVYYSGGNTSLFRILAETIFTDQIPVLMFLRAGYYQISRLKSYRSKIKIDK